MIYKSNQHFLIWYVHEWFCMLFVPFFLVRWSIKSVHVCLKDSIVLALNCSNAARLPDTQECSTTSSGAYFIFASV